MNIQNWQTQLRKGILDIVVLNFLAHGRRHGYEMVQALKQCEGLRLREGNIYPILARLQAEGLIESQKEAGEGGPPRKYFSLTGRGRKTMEEMNGHWRMIVQSVDDIQKGNNP